MNTPGTRRLSAGFSLIELLFVLAISGLLLAGMQGMIGTVLKTEDAIGLRNDSLQQARYAMQQMLNAVRKTRRLMLPLGENPATAWSESVRDVLAVTLDPSLDRDKDDWADGNNDKDFLDLNNNGTRNAGEPERIDEDPGGDLSWDLAAGIIGIDDDGDGLIDEEHTGTGPLGEDDDEDGTANEDGWENGDEDGDGSLDEDPKKQMNSDGLPGIGGVDDDGDGTVDEGDKNDDDEDGAVNEDWFDPVVFHLNGSTLLQRIPDINPVDGTDYTEYPIAENVSDFVVKRIPGNNGSTVLVDISLTLSPPGGEPVTLNSRVRVGSGL